MSVGEWSLVVALLVNAAVVMWGMWRIEREVGEIHHETNSMRTALETAKKAEGKLEEQQEELARNRRKKGTKK